MAKINIKTNFVDGEKLFAQQLNNNFKAIQEGMNSDNKIIWQDGEEVLFKRYVTNDIESLPILDGSLIYDVEKGRHYIDYNGARIQVGSAGKEVLVQDNEPTEEDNKIWIDKDFVNTMGTEVVDSLDGDEINMAPSVRVVKEKINEVIESGSNEKGSWTKYADGTMMCHYNKKVTTEIKKTWGSLYTSEIIAMEDFPQAFVEVPDLSFEVIQGYSALVLNSSDASDKKPCDIQLCSAIATNNTPYTISVMAFGKYKQGGVSDEV